MSLTRLAIAVFGVLALVFTALLAGVALAGERELGERASSARAAYRRDAFATEVLLQQLCDSDVRVERLALELGAGGSGEGELARALARQTGGELWLLLEREGRVQALGAGNTPAALPGPTELRLARAQPLAWPPSSPDAQHEALSARSDQASPAEAREQVEREPASSARAATERSAPSERAEREPASSARAATDRAAPREPREPAPRLLRACSRAAGSSLLWLVRAEAIPALAARLLPDDGEATLSLEPRVDDGLRIAEVAGQGGDFALALAATRRPRVAELAALIPLAALSVVFGALLVYFAIGRRQLDDSVLLELERAAERVAMGDLRSRIERRPGGRADQTFQTFDRMTQELYEMRARLAEAERATAWQDIARRIAHEIKNPLSPIQLAMETLRKAHRQRLPEFDEIFEESTRAILDEVRRIEHIVREFSEFARLPKPRPLQLELSALVADTVALYRPEDVPLELVATNEALFVRVDREQITQVIVNLLHNALDAARETAAPKVALTIELSREGATAHALVHVDDSGRGVSPADRERVFEPYYTTKEHGTGLGLAIVRRIVSEHGGSVQIADSELGGARFTLRLPA